MSVSSTIIYYVCRGTHKALLTDPLVPSTEKTRTQTSKPLFRERARTERTALAYARRRAAASR